MADSMKLERAAILPEPDLPDYRELVAQGRRLAGAVALGSCAFLEKHGVDCELEYKRRRVAAGEIMFQAQVGYRDIEKTERACLEIDTHLRGRGYRVDRYGLIFDRSMGYPSSLRPERPRGTGLVVDDPERLRRLTARVPVAPHFGDHMIGPPASVENTVMALEAGSTSLGNLAQYYTFDLLYEGGDVPRTEATVKAIALVAALPVEVIIHSNLDDGFASMFTDLCCSIGMVLVEQRIVGNLLGATLAHSFGQTSPNPFHRIAFQRALGRVEPRAGTMIYGDTTGFRPEEWSNIAVLATSLTADLLAQRLSPTLHAIVPVPLTEFSRIPEPEEIITAQEAANGLNERVEALLPLVDVSAADAMADRMVEGGRHFASALFQAFEEAGIDTGNPVELLLAIKRLGPRRLEMLFGPGERSSENTRRRPVLPSNTIVEVETRIDTLINRLPEDLPKAIRARELVACIATTDVHEWGKLGLERAFEQLGVSVIDAGVNADPERVVRCARNGGADFIALSTYNGIALTYARALRREMKSASLELPVYLGGRLNQVPEGSNTSLPVDVTANLRDIGCRPCADIEEMLRHLSKPDGG